MAKTDCVMECKNCALYKPEQGESFGFCHRYPPQPIIDEGGYSFAFPGVNEDDFCGEFVRGGN